MLNTTIKKKTQILGLILVLSILLIATTAFARTKLIKAGRSGTIVMDAGVKIKIPRGALLEDTLISAEMEVTSDQVRFIFGPSPLAPQVPANLMISWSAIKDLNLDGFTLYGPNDEEIEPSVISGWGMVWEIPHFSLYYHRRR